MLRDPDEGRLLVRRGRDGFRELGFVLYAESSAHAEAVVELHMGDLDAAERVLREGSAVLEAVGETASLANQKGLLAWILARTGRADEALELAAQSSSIAAARVAHAYWRRGRSLALAQLGRHDEALAVAREAVGVIADTGDMHSHAEMLENLAEVASLGGAEEEAHGALEQAAALFEREGLHRVRGAHPRRAGGLGSSSAARARARRARAALGAGRGRARAPRLPGQAGAVRRRWRGGWGGSCPQDGAPGRVLPVGSRAVAEVRKVGVVGLGTMGAGIAQLCVEAGFETRRARGHDRARRGARATASRTS